jgi:hypothetical protein
LKCDSREKARHVTFRHTQESQLFLRKLLALNSFYLNEENMSEVAGTLDILPTGQRKYVRSERYFGHFLA